MKEKFISKPNQDSQSEEPTENTGGTPVAAAKKPYLLIVIICIACLTVFSCIYTIEQGNRGIVLRFGSLSSIAEPGLHFKLPFVDSVMEMNVRTKKITVPKLAIYSKDVQGAEVRLSVNYALNPAKVGDIYSVATEKYEDNIITPQVMAKPKDVFGKYNAVDIIQNREKLVSEILHELEKHFKDTGIIIQTVQLENIDFSDSYEQSVEERMKAEVEVQKVKQNLEREKLNAEMVRTKAQGLADAKIAEAKAEAAAIELRGNAEANAIRVKSEALKDNKDYVHLLQAEKWSGVLPQVTGSAVPLLNFELNK